MYELDKRITSAIKGGCLVEIFYGFIIFCALIFLISFILWLVGGVPAAQ